MSDQANTEAPATAENREQSNKSTKKDRVSNSASVGRMSTSNRSNNGFSPRSPRATSSRGSSRGGSQSTARTHRLYSTPAYNMAPLSPRIADNDAQSKDQMNTTNLTMMSAMLTPRNWSQFRESDVCKTLGWSDAPAVAAPPPGVPEELLTGNPCSVSNSGRLTKGLDKHKKGRVQPPMGSAAKKQYNQPDAFDDAWYIYQTGVPRVTKHSQRFMDKGRAANLTTLEASLLSPHRVETMSPGSWTTEQHQATAKKNQDYAERSQTKQPPQPPKFIISEDLTKNWDRSVQRVSLSQFQRERLPNCTNPFATNARETAGGAKASIKPLQSPRKLRYY